MKVRSLVLCVGVLTLISAAQTATGDITVDVPFSFVAGGQILPAGHYIVKTAGLSYIRIFSPGGSGVNVPTHAASRFTSDATKVIFHCYDEACFLSEVWTAGSTTGRELYRSRAERELNVGNSNLKLAEVRPTR